MPKDLNKLLFTGRLTGDPEPSNHGGTDYSNFSIAVNNSWKDKQTGENVEHPEFVPLSASGPKAKFINQYLKKGTLVWIEARWNTSRWQDKDGKNQSRAVPKVLEIQVMARPKGAQPQGNEMPPGQPQEPLSDGELDSIPF